MCCGRWRLGSVTLREAREHFFCRRSLAAGYKSEIHPGMNSPPTAPPPCCSLCGRADADMDAWLSICHACLARAGRAAAEVDRQAAAHDSRVAGYRLVRLIGRGSMGTVHEAVREKDGERVALKRIHPEMAALPRFSEQFQREVEALGVLAHPGIVRMLGLETQAGQEALVLEFIDGPDLRQVLKLGPLPVQRAVQIVAEIAEAMSSAHAAGLIHRDIKPANILIAADGKAKVADFGMVRPPRHEPPETRLADTLVAAPGHYNAPELERHGIADARADIYSLGALLYHLLTGEPPRAHYLPASRMRVESLITPRLDEIIERALQTEPFRRFGSMAEMAAQLRREEARIMEFLADPGARYRRLWRAVALVALISVVSWLGSAGYRTHLAALERQALLARLIPVPRDWKPDRWKNSLGMEFVSIPECEVMFCIWETRVKDYAEYAGLNPAEERAWATDTGFAFPRKEPCFALVRGAFTAGIHEWRAPGFESGPTHPVCGVSLFDAEAFCMWLTWKERGSGLIKQDQAYRLPTDEEWSRAAGLRPEPGSTPEERLASWTGGRLLYEWGADFEPVPTTVNTAGREVATWEHWPWTWARVRHTNPWLGTAPVDSTPPSARGLHHLTGNVWEWTESPINLENQSQVITLRGGSWTNSLPEHLSLMARDSDRGVVRMTKRGFRVVFQTSGAKGWRYGGKR